MKLPSIICSACHYWHGSDTYCPAPHSGPRFSCANHQNYDEFMKLVNDAIKSLEDIEMPDNIEAGDVELTRKETLQEMHAYLLKALRKSEDNLDKHRRGIWASGQDFVSKAEGTVKKWHRWCNLVAEIIAETP